MILQYKGLKDTWCYEYAEVISFTNIYIGDIFNKNIKDLKLIHEEIDNLLKQETDACEEIIYHIDNVMNVENICVVTLQDKNKYVSKVFDKAVYLLNDKGEKIKQLN